MLDLERLVVMRVRTLSSSRGRYVEGFRILFDRARVAGYVVGPATQRKERRSRHGRGRGRAASLPLSLRQGGQWSMGSPDVSCPRMRLRFGITRSGGS